MYCRACGKEIADISQFCTSCGCRTALPQPLFPNGQPENFQEKPVDKVSVWIVVLCIFLPIVGIILGVVNLKDGKKKSGKVYLIVGIVSTVVYIILLVIYLWFIFDIMRLIYNAMFRTDY